MTVGGVQNYPTEPDVFELEEGNHRAAAADAKLPPVVASEKSRAAAAAGDAFASNANANANANAAPAVEQTARELVADLMPDHPEPGNPGRAVAEARTVLAASDVEATAKTIRRNHGSWREHWASLPRDRFIPQLWRWLHSGEWEYPPAGRKGVERETYVDRHRREMRAVDERHWMVLAEIEDWDQLRAEGQDPEVWRERLKATA
jgi:pyruvate/2-oxoglutarate dehydrogenase complex dihydrolipoamide acyltransferase (E2) component